MREGPSASQFLDGEIATRDGVAQAELVEGAGAVRVKAIGGNEQTGSECVAVLDLVGDFAGGCVDLHELFQSLTVDGSITRIQQTKPPLVDVVALTRASTGVRGGFLGSGDRLLNRGLVATQ